MCSIKPPSGGPGRPYPWFYATRPSAGPARYRPIRAIHCRQRCAAPRDPLRLPRAALARRRPQPAQPGKPRPARHPPQGPGRARGASPPALCGPARSRGGGGSRAARSAPRRRSRRPGSDLPMIVEELRVLGDQRRPCRATVRLDWTCARGEGGRGELGVRARRQARRGSARAPGGDCGDAQRLCGLESATHLVCSAGAFIFSRTPDGHLPHPTRVSSAAQAASPGQWSCR